MKNNSYNYSTLVQFVTILFKRQGRKMHRARIKALVVMVQGVLYLRQAWLSGMARGAVILNEETTFVSQLKRAHRLMKNAGVDAWELALVLFSHMTEGQARVTVAVDWTVMGHYQVLEACLVVQGRGIPVYCLAVPETELKGRQTTLEMTMWYALMALRQEGQILVVVADRGFAKFDWIGSCPWAPWMHLCIRLRANMILTWDTVSGPLQQWPLWKGEVVYIQRALLGVHRQVVTGMCLANLGQVPDQPLYLACAPEDQSIILEAYKQRGWVEQQNRDLKSPFQMKRIHLATADRLQRMWMLMGLAFYISYCNETVQDTAFAQRLGRRYKDGRQDLSWLSLARYAELSGQVQLWLRPLAA
jgi:hypothetical protein